MLNHKSLVTAVLLGVGCAISAPAVFADTSVTVEKTHKHHYVYYGDHQIYFAPETKTYYWQNDGHWVSGTTLPEEDRAYVTTKGYEFDLDTDKPYERHDWVIAHYKHHDDGDRHDKDDD